MSAPAFKQFTGVKMPSILWISKIPLELQKTA